MSDKPWFYRDPDRYDDKSSFVLAWILTVAVMAFIFAGILTGQWRYIWAAIAAAIFQWALEEAQVPPKDRKYNQ